ncbi:ClpP-like prohead protease/major capsid protein fusion protein [Comamonas sediminis]|uniref:ATP-dependent Clp protease proteolytic subunit n=1 Tax=Comamonas sediminis TaxID=1783360 RepID=A0ABV4B925_9BURK
MSAAQAQPWYTVRHKTAISAAAAGVQSAAEVLIYGDIGESWCDETVAAKDFVREISALDVTELTVRINSYGGSVTDGMAIHNALKRHKAHVVTEVDGCAYSISSLIAQAGSTRRMASNALMMVHAPWDVVLGNAAVMREYADSLDQYATAMATSFVAKGVAQADIDAWLADGKDHYFTAQEALAQGLIDEISDPLPIAASAHVRDAAQARYSRQPAAVVQPRAATAAMPTKENSMDKPETQAVQTSVVAAAPTAVAAQDQQAIVQAALQADKERRQAIAAQFAPFAQREGVSALLRQCEDDSATTVAAAGQKLLSHMAKGVEPIAGSVVTVADEADVQRAAKVKALLARAGLGKQDGANPYRGHTLLEMARASAARAGVGVGDKMQVVASAFTHSTSDFPMLLQEVARSAMSQGYTEADETFPLWTRAGTLNDFRPSKRVSLGAFANLDLIPEGGEYKSGTIGESGQSVVLATYGKMFSITRQAIINDDLGAFAAIPRAMGRAAIRTVADLVYAVLNGNPVMDEDGKTLFHADHGNLLPAAGITTDSVDAMQSAMALQKTKDGHVTNVPLKYLLVPVSLRGAANTVRASEFAVGASAKNNTVPNIVRESFEVIADARLDAKSKLAWYGAADPNLYDTVEVNYLDGNQTPYLEQQQGWTVDGTEFKVRIDAGVSPLNFRGLAKNPGQ